MVRPLTPRIRYWHSEATNKILVYCPDLPGIAACGEDRGTALSRLKLRLGDLKLSPQAEPALKVLAGEIEASLLHT